MNEKYVLEGLSCPNCAGRIECRLKEDEKFENVNLNFTMKTLTLEGGDRDYIQSIIDSIEDGIVLKELAHDSNGHGYEHGHSHEHSYGGSSSIWKSLAPIILAGILVVSGLFVEDFYIKLAVYVVAYLIVGGEIVLRAFKNILKGKVFDENFLMAVATIGAFVIGEYLEGVAVMIFYQLGEFIQDLAVDKSREAIVELMDIRPDYANLLVDGEIKKVSPEEVSIGDIIVVKASEKVSLDGTVIEGSSELDASSLTGESLPRLASAGDEVLSGSINMTGTLKIKVMKEFGDSTVSKIMDMVENASSKKASTEKFITKFARVYTPIVVGLAVLLAILPPVIMATFDFTPWIQRGLIFLVVSCPCALVISVPLSYFGGIGGASRMGILIKGGNYLESLTEVATVVMDKTGTITKGRLAIKEVLSLFGSEDEFLNKVKRLESASNHPIARCIVGDDDFDIDGVKNYREDAGFGVYGELDGNKYFVGNDKLMRREGVDFKEADGVGTVLYVAENGKYIGHILLADEMKDTSVQAIKELKKAGIRTVMLTGDNEKVATYVGKEVGIDDVYSELLPHEKVDNLEKYMDGAKNTIFVGDGINDAPSLARADIGFAMGGIGSDAATAASDVVLMKDELLGVSDSIKIAKRTKKIVWENIIIALGVKVLVMVLATFGVATMWAAIFADVGVALIAILNSARIIKRPC